MEKGICKLSLIPLRKEPSHRSEMVSQLIYGERYTLLENTSAEWLKIACDYDQYEGYIAFNQFEAFSESDKPKLYTGLIAQTQKNVLISKGSEIFAFDTLTDPTDNELVDQEHLDLNLTALREHIFFQSMSMLHTAYLWGGRSIFGIDCSGFTQIVYKVCKVFLPRDASQQALIGESISLKESATGDLAFFNNPEGKITHVGIILDNSMIIHASGSVRVDQIHPAGIINLDTMKKTHSLHSIRRVLA